MKITLAMLHKLDACCCDLLRFQKTFPDGIEIPDDTQLIRIVVNSNLLSQIEWLYSKKLLRTPVMIETPDTIIHYNKNGNKIRCENSNGFWEEWQYDENGNPIKKYKNSNGFWEEWQYDENGNQIRCQDSDGAWKEWQYDENGNLVSHTYPRSNSISEFGICQISFIKQLVPKIDYITLDFKVV